MLNDNFSKSLEFTLVKLLNIDKLRTLVILRLIDQGRIEPLIGQLVFFFEFRNFLNRYVHKNFLMPKFLLSTTIIQKSSL